MSNFDFDNVFDNVLTTIKKATNVAGKKTSEAVEIGKIKYKEQSVSRNLTKAYAKLGVLVYESKTKKEDLADVIDQAVKNITELNLELDGLTEKFESAVEDIKKPVDENTVVAEVDIDLDEVVDDGDDTLKHNDIVEDVVDVIDDKSSELSKEVDDMVEDIKSNLE